MNKWISVAERLPENNQWLLVYNGSYMCVCWIDRSSQDYVFMYGMSGREQIKNVTHWMHLPDAPELVCKSTKKRLEIQRGDYEAKD